MTACQERPDLRPLRWARDAAKPAGPSEPTERQLPYGNGTFQLLVLFSASISLGTYGLHYESFSLTAGVMNHWCRRPDAFANLSVFEWKNIAIPLDERGEFSRCLIRDPPDAGDDTRVIPCTSWEFDLDQFGNNIVSEWNLVCDRRWLIEVARLVSLAACLVSLAVVGTLADRVGRKTVVFITIPVVLIAGTGSSVPNNFLFFVTVRAVLLAAMIALIPPMLAIFYEVTPSSRIPEYTTVGSLLAVVITPTTLFFAKLYRAGWAALQLILMIPTCLLILTYYSVDESPAWLLARGHGKEAERVALLAASLNKVSLEHCHEMMLNYLQTHTDNRRSPESGKLCGTDIRARTVLLACMSTALSYAYDTFVVNSVGLPVNDTITAIYYIVTFIGLLLVVPCLGRFGFRRVVVATAVIFGTLLAVFVIAPRENDTLVRNSLVVLMRVAGTICFSSFVSQAAGAYPVVAHSSGLAWLLAFSIIGDSLGRTSTALFDDRHIDVRLAIAAAAMSLFAVGAQVLPYQDDWVLQGQRTSGLRSVTTHAPNSTRTMQETLLPLPKEPVKRRSTTELDRVSLPRDNYSTHSIQKSVTISLG